MDNTWTERFGNYDCLVCCSSLNLKLVTAAKFERDICIISVFPYHSVCGHHRGNMCMSFVLHRDSYRSALFGRLDRNVRFTRSLPYMSCISKTTCFLANYAPHSLRAGRKMEPYGSKRISFSKWSERLKTNTGLKPRTQASANQRPSRH